MQDSGPGLLKNVNEKVILDQNQGTRQSDTVCTMLLGILGVREGKRKLKTVPGTAGGAECGLDTEEACCVCFSGDP